MPRAIATETAFRSEEEFTQAGFRRWLARRPASDIGHYELIRGRIVMSPPAGWPHAGIGSALNHLLRSQVVANRLGRVFDASAGYELPSGDTLEPDVSFISSDRFEAGPRPTPGQFLRIVPDLVVEILSPSTARRDRTEKLEIYARNGVGEYWLVDPKRRQITVFRRAGDAFAEPVVLRPGVVLASQVVRGFAARVEDVFADAD